MDNKKTGSVGGIGFTGALTILFIALKLCGVIDWSWKWVLAPIWITAIVTGIIFLIYVLVLIVKEARKR